MQECCSELGKLNAARNLVGADLIEEDFAEIGRKVLQSSQRLAQDLQQSARIQNHKCSGIFRKGFGQGKDLLPKTPYRSNAWKVTCVESA